MFVGHYSASFLIKSIEPRLPLWLLILAAQLLDIFWASLVLIGIEKVNIVPGITKLNPLDLYYMPYTHGLLTALGWAFIAGIIYYLIKGRDRLASILLALAVFSHWVCDLLVHRPDLPLLDNSNKIGLGLWNYPIIELPLEIALLLISIGLYYRSAKNKLAVSKIFLVVFTTILLAAHLYATFGPVPINAAGLAISGLAAYLIFAAIAYWLERLAKIKSQARIDS